MSIIEKAVNKLTNDPIEPNRIVQKKDSENVSQVFGAVVAEADRVSGHRFSNTKEASDENQSVEESANETVKIDLKLLRKEQVALVNDDNPRLDEELRMIKRRLLVNAAGLGDTSIEKGNLIMVTSSVPDEGKTFIAINLALSIAREIDRRVMLIDADVAKSDTTKNFGLSDKPGLTELLTGESSFNEVLVNTDIEGLTILPTGKKVNNVTELISSNRMADLINDLSSRYKDRIIIFDCPPILVTSEAPVLASLVGQVAFVVRAGETKEKEFVSAIERLDHSKYVGLILNQSDEESGSSYYGYYHKS
ncbi:MAG: XrtA-associated tyrosine autokinase [Gammaproteobacteria bacterium]